MTLVYLFIPSFLPDDGDVAQQLHPHERVTRVFHTEKFFPYPHCLIAYPRLEHTPKGECALPPKLRKLVTQYSRNIILDLRYAIENGTHYLTLSGGSSLTSRVLSFLGSNPPLTEVQLPLKFEDAETTLSESLSVTVRSIPWGPFDLSPKWFTIADSVLIKWWYGRWDTATVPLRVLRDPRKHSIEVWPEHLDWKDFHINVCSFLLFHAPHSHFRAQHTTPQGIHPLVSVRDPLHCIAEAEQEPMTGFASLLSEICVHFYTFTFNPESFSPTAYTLQARLILLLFLIPLGYAGYWVAIGLWTPFYLGVKYLPNIISYGITILSTLLLIGMVSAVGWWLANGRLEMAEVLRLLRVESNERTYTWQAADRG